MQLIRELEAYSIHILLFFAALSPKINLQVNFGALSVPNL